MGHRDILEVWRLAPLCLMWCFWREHNAQNFEDRDFSGRAEKDYIQLPLHMNRAHFFSSNFSIFLTFVLFSTE